MAYRLQSPRRLPFPVRHAAMTIHRTASVSEDSAGMKTNVVFRDGSDSKERIMAGFKTHIGTSMTVGACYGGVGAYLGLPVESCILAGGICGISGILPDLGQQVGRTRA